MSETRLQYRWRMVMEEHIVKGNPNTSVLNRHKRSYLLGHIRCVNCKTWVDPNNPEEVAKEIGYGKNGKRIHKNCPIKSLDPPRFVTVARSRGTGRRKRLDAIKRY